MYNKMFILIPSVLVLSCANSQTVCGKKKEMSKEADRGVMVGENQNYIEVINKDKTLILYYKVSQIPSDPANRIEYYVQEVASKKIIRKDIYRGTSVEWGEGRNLELTPYVGMIQKDPDEIPIEDKEIKNKELSNKIIIKL